MALVIRFLYSKIIDLSTKFDEDPRVRDLPFIGSPVPMLTVILIYVLFAKKWGPEWMNNRKPYNVKFFIQMHNVLQIVLCTYAFTFGFWNSYLQRDFSWTCRDVDINDTSPATLQLLNATYVYYITKYLDLFDTIFFVLRKKTSHLSFLHIYHHSIMIFAVWLYLTFLFGSHGTMLGIVNTFVHMLMYTYYFVSSMNLKIDLIPWKKRITKLQIAQFGYLVLHFSLPIFNNWCKVKFNVIHIIAAIQNIFMGSMFTDFYIRSYLKKNRNR